MGRILHLPFCSLRKSILSSAGTAVVDEAAKKKKKNFMRKYIKLYIGKRLFVMNQCCQYDPTNGTIISITQKTYFNSKIHIIFRCLLMIVGIFKILFRVKCNRCI